VADSTDAADAQALPKGPSLSWRAGLLVVSNTVKYALGIGLQVALARLLSTADYGTYQQLLLVGGIAVGIMNLGLPTSIYYFLHRIPEERRHLVVVQTIVLLLIFGAAASLARWMHNDSLSGLLPIYSLYVVFFLGAEATVPVLINRDRYQSVVMLEGAEAVVRVSLLLVPMLLFGSLRSLAVALAVYGFLRFVAFAGLLHRDFRRLERADAGRTFVVAQMGYGLPLAATRLVSLLGGVIDRAIVALWFGAEQYAIYSVGAVELPMDVILQGSIADVIRATAPPLVRDGRHDEIARILREAVRKASIVIFPVFLFMLVFSADIILTVFTARYKESVRVFQIYLFLVPLQVLFLSAIPQAFGRTKINFAVGTAGAVAKIVLSFVLLSMVGFYGPALATVAANWISSLIYIVVVTHLLRAPVGAILPFGALARVAGCAGGAALVAHLLYRYTPGGLVGLIVAGLVFGLLYVSSVLLAGVITPEERRLARRLAARVWPGLG
jgi:O-antigen/teichoic acid export membrane protein